MTWGTGCADSEGLTALAPGTCAAALGLGFPLLATRRPDAYAPLITSF
ncbi:hypothetical protein ACFWZT_15285 [Streptomyces alboflavus]